MNYFFVNHHKFFLVSRFYTNCNRFYQDIFECFKDFDCLFEIEKQFDSQIRVKGLCRQSRAEVFWPAGYGPKPVEIGQIFPDLNLINSKFDIFIKI